MVQVLTATKTARFRQVLGSPPVVTLEQKRMVLTGPQGRIVY